MMSATFDQNQLQPGFTIRLVEIIKQTKIQPGPQTPVIPVGLSVTGALIVATLLSLIVPLDQFFPIGRLIGSPVPGQTQVAEVGEIPVDVVDITKSPILSSEKGKADYGKMPAPHHPPNAFTPAGQAGTWRKRADMPTPRDALGASEVDGVIYAIGAGGSRVLKYWRHFGGSQIYDNLGEH